MTDEQVAAITDKAHIDFTPSKRWEWALREAYRLGVAAERKRCADIARQHPDTLASVGGAGSGTFKAISKVAEQIERGE